MTFYLGTHQANWLERATVPLFVSRRRLCDRKRLPRAQVDWALDSGGFSELSQWGDWTISEAQYIAEVRRYRDAIGGMEWVSPMDWMCEPWIVERTGLTVEDHQRRTLLNYRRLTDAAPEVPWVPVLQGWQTDDYLRHADQYAAAGVDLARLPRVGLGSVCRRQGTIEAEGIVRSLAGLRLHGYGFKTSGLYRAADALVSADSMAWSAGARRKPPLPGCRHQNCANCPRWAMLWRDRVIARLAENEQRPKQFSLGL